MLETNDAIRIDDASSAGPAVGTSGPVAPARMAPVVRRKHRDWTRGKGFTDEEARTILRASLQKRAQSVRYAAAMRWVPWIAAYTGARQGEILRLRREDVHECEGISSIVLFSSPSARRNLFRIVPLHRHLLEQGFPSFAGGSVSSRLFLDDVPDRNPVVEAAAVERTGRHLTRWVRSLGIPMEVAASGGWRHRFYLQARYGNIDIDVICRIMGRRPYCISKFGPPTLARLSSGIDGIPIIDPSS